jgi:hemolysin activation/secretion protein
VEHHQQQQQQQQRQQPARSTPKSLLTLPIDTSKGPLDGTTLTTMQDTNFAAAAKAMWGREITAMELNEETKRVTEAGRACITKKMKDSKLLGVSEIGSRVMNKLFLNRR